MSGMSDEDIKRWMASRPEYAKYAGNVKLGRVLYEREKGASNVARQLEDKLYKIADLKDVVVGSRIAVAGIVAEIGKPIEYEGCVVCRRKKCVEHSEAGVKKYRVDMFLLGDETGMVWCIARDMQIVDRSEVVVRGVIKDYKGEREISVFRIDRVDKVPEGQTVKGTVDDILDFVRLSGMAKVEIVKSLCERKGVNYKELERYGLREDGRGFVWIDREAKKG